MQKRVLIVDDEPLVRYSLVKGLQVIGAEVKAVESGEDAIAELNSCFYDMCFLDINLPGLSGLEVLKKTREISPSTKVFIMSGSSVEEHLSDALSDGADHFISKPFNISHIRAITKSALWGDSIWQATPETAHPPDFSEKRKSTRLPVHSPSKNMLSIFDCDGIEWTDHNCVLLDLSKEGMGVLTFQPVIPNCLCTIRQGAEHRTGVVRWTVPVEEGGAYRAGIEFLQS